jgi:mono/diheme cytochrome c family protein
MQSGYRPPILQIGLVVIGLMIDYRSAVANDASELLDRRPQHVAVSPDGSLAVVTNGLSGTISLVDLKQETVLQEISLGGKPFAAIWPASNWLAVTIQESREVVRLRLEWQSTTPSLKPLVIDCRSKLLAQPSGLAFLPATDGTPDRLLVTQVETDELALLDAKNLQPLSSWPTGGLPYSVVVSPDRQWVVVGCRGPSEVLVYNAVTGQQLSRRKIYDDGFNLGWPAFGPDGTSVIYPAAINRRFPVTAGYIEQGWVIDNRLIHLKLPDSQPGEQDHLGLDVRKQAVGDAFAVAHTPDKQSLVVSCSGTQELLVLRLTDLPWQPGDPGDFVRPELAADSTRYRRIELGGRPLGFSIMTNDQVVVANDFLRCLQLVTLSTGEVRQIRLGESTPDSLARRGEQIFAAADRSLSSWYSCQTCHPGGGTSGQIFDTRNDGGYGLPKLVPSLHGVSITGPWTWHGWQNSLPDAMSRSLKESMQTQQDIQPADIEALTAYMESLTSVAPSPAFNQPAQAQGIANGKVIFQGKGACINCHAPAGYTTPATFDVGRASKQGQYFELNPPSLLGLAFRRRFLHDGKAKSLEQVLTKFHAPEKVAGEALSPEERRDLIAFLNSL